MHKERLDMTDDFSQLFDLMDRWRHLPKYKLEGNLQPFFGLFLKDILQATLDVGVVHEPVIPEFPLLVDRIDSGDKNKKSRRSKNVDFLALTKKENKTTVYLIELKTDNASFKYDQLQDYLKFAKEGLSCLVNDVLYIAKGGGARHRKNKYGHLLDLLEKLNLIEISDRELFDNQYTENPNSWPDVLEEIQPHSGINCIDYKVKVIYIIPCKCKFDKSLEKSRRRLEENGLQQYLCDPCAIPFKSIVPIVKKAGPLYRKLACCLNEWAKEEAGKPCPGIVHKCP